MANRIMQFRYYGDKGSNNQTSNNQPSDINASKLASGNIFSGYLPIIQLGIQTLPGTKFYLNNSSYPVVIGSTGIYELNINNAYSISNLCFEGSSLRHLIEYNEEDEKDSRAAKGYIIIDIIYEKKE